MGLSRFFGRREAAVEPQGAEKKESEIKTEEILELSRLMEEWYKKYLLYQDHFPPINLQKEIEAENKSRNRFKELEASLGPKGIKQAWVLIRDSAGEPLSAEDFRYCVEDLRKPYGVF